jgi:hypothetical protein
VLTYSIAFLSLVVWYSGAKIVKAIENHGRQSTSPEIEPMRAGDVVTNGIELQLAAIHRVLLDGLKPVWWIELNEKMKEFDQSAKPPDTGDYHENQHRLIERESELASEISRLPLHAVDPTLYAFVKNARMENIRQSHIADLLKAGKGSVSEAELLLRECEEADRLHSLSPSVGQHDLINWFQNSLTSSHQQRGFLELKLRDFIKANIQPKK